MVIIGIDLGTTNSAVAVFEDGFAQVIQDERGKRLIPSMVTFTEEKILVGASAKSNAHRYPEDTIYDAKRFIGQKFHDKNVQTDKGNSLYKVVNKEGRPYVKVTYRNDDLIISIEEVTAHLLRHVKSVAENHLNHSVSGAVIAVPAHFDDTRRNATKKAAEIADFQMVRIINEPTAAAIAANYKSRKLHSRNVLVYDFGGGTFDVSIVSLQGKNVKVITTDGDCYLGGKDIDENLMQHIMDIQGLEITNCRILRRFRTVCQDAKENLSFSEEYLVDVTNVIPKDYSITRQEFETISEALFQKTIDLIDRSLSTAELRVDDISEVVVVGGSSRIPRVRQLLKTKFPKSTINTSLNPDEAIALGAAIYGGQINGDKVLLEIQDILTHSLGIEYLGDMMGFVIKQNTKLPCSEQISFKTSENFQTAMMLSIYQGESFIASKNNLLGQFSITDIRKERRGAVEILATMAVNEEGILTVTATEAGTDNSKELTISFTDGIGLAPPAQEIDLETQEEELQYVGFNKRRYVFLAYCEDLKFDYQDQLKHRPDVLRKIQDIIERGESLKREEELVIEDLMRQLELLVEKHLDIK